MASSLGEIAAMQQATVGNLDFGSRLGQMLQNQASIIDIDRRRQMAEKEKYEFNQQRENQGLDILSGTMRDPAWNSGDVHQILGTIGRAREQAIARGVPITRGGIFDQAERELWRAAESGNPADAVNAARNARKLIEETVLQRAGPQSLYGETKPAEATVGEQPASRTAGGIGSGGQMTYGGVQVNNQPSQQPQQQSVQQTTQPSGPGTNVQPTTPSGPQSHNFQFQYPDRRPGGPMQFFRSGEEADYKLGNQIKQNVLSNSDSLAKRKLNNQNAYQLASKISNNRLFQTGVLGAVEKGFEEQIQQNTAYKEMAKNQAIAMINNRGGETGEFAKTDAGRQWLSIAQGGDAPPAVYRKLLLQSIGDDAKDTMFNQLIVDTPTRLGNQNPANLPHLQNKFNELGSDFRAFQLIGIENSPMSREEKVAAVKIVLEGASPDQAKELVRRVNDLKKLVGTK